jgi:hypothetical protein
MEKDKKHARESQNGEKVQMRKGDRKLVYEFVCERGEDGDTSNN